MPIPRALITVRLTSNTTSTTSPERQFEECSIFCAARGWQVVGSAWDIGTSATTTPPWERSELGVWLDERAPDFDNIVFWRLDRFVRRVADLQTMIEWAQGHGGKGLVSATEPFDLTSPFGGTMATMIATFARMESRAASERVASMRQHLLPSARWGGGKPPFGYRTYSKGGGRHVEINPETAAVIHEATRRVLDGTSVHAICRDFEERHISAPADAYEQNKSGRDFVWHPATLKKILTSQSLLGYKTRSETVPGKKYRQRVCVEDQNGNPVKVADAILASHEFDALQAELKLRSRKQPARSENQKTPFLGIIRCAGCGKKLTVHTTKRKRKDGSYRVTERIRCLSRPGSPACTGFAWPPEEITLALMTCIFDRIGTEPITRRVYASGQGNSSLEDHWAYEQLGPTYAQQWAQQDSAAIRSDLLRGGVTFLCAPADKGGHRLVVPKDLHLRLAKASAWPSNEGLGQDRCPPDPFRRPGEHDTRG